MRANIVVARHLITIKWKSIVHNVLLLIFAGAESAASKAEIERHLDLGKDMLARGQLGDALTHYHAAVGQLNLFVFIFRLFFFSRVRNMV